MSTPTHLPEPETVAARAREVLEILHQWPGFERLWKATRMYPDCWGTFTGYPTIAQFDLEQDAGPLLNEALKTMALKTAVFELTGGDETAAELVIPAPVDEMIHALLAQHNLARRFETETGLHLVHMTDRERFGWERGDYTHRCYLAAWGEVPERYWIDNAETARRHRILGRRLASIGIQDLGRRHTLTFADEPEEQRDAEPVPA